MRLHIRETGEVVYSDEFRRLNSETSFPAELTPEIVADFGADIVFNGAQPTLTENQYAKYDGVEEVNGQWFTKYVATDYTSEELSSRLEQWRNSASCTPFQGRMALSDANLLSAVDAAIAGADEKTKVAWEYALEWRRNSPMIATLMAALNISDAQADELFKAAQQIQA